MIYQFTMFVRVALLWPPSCSMGDNVSHVPQSLCCHTSVTLCHHVSKFYVKLKFIIIVMIQHSFWSTGQNLSFWLWSRWGVAKDFWPSNSPIQCIDLGLSHLTWLAGQSPVFLPIITAQKTKVFPFLACKSTQIHPSHPPSPLCSDITSAYWSSTVHLSNSLRFINTRHHKVFGWLWRFVLYKKYVFSHLQV